MLLARAPSSSDAMASSSRLVAGVLVGGLSGVHLLEDEARPALGVPLAHNLSQYSAELNSSAVRGSRSMSGRSEATEAPRRQTAAHFPATESVDSNLSHMALTFPAGRHCWRHRDADWWLI
ncbi:hypothetical protein EYF80_048144 [Liparis tanakae]|uniref:Uncharacterized protein n=1 Tax=Liparis tanakae TaxID=230148 RepID=A0A4Z2FLC9_9TELE|nr:hypothetical protein EYF80_048144 [Liparis tanakae]